MYCNGSAVLKDDSNRVENTIPVYMLKNVNIIIQKASKVRFWVIQMIMMMVFWGLKEGMNRCVISYYKGIIFGNDTSISRECLNKLIKKPAIDKRVHDQKLMENTLGKLTWDSLQKNIVVDDDLVIDKREVKVLGPEVGYTCYKRILSQFYSLYRP